MAAKMLLEIENLGLINKANLEIRKINVIVGKNSTGKSTSSKRNNREKRSNRDNKGIKRKDIKR